MKKSLILACVLVLLALPLVACSAPAEKSASEQVSIEVSCDDFMKIKHISEETEVAVDGTLTVTLCSNRTTGFEWAESAEVSDSTVLEQTNHKFVAPGTDVTGAAGKEVWTFEALKKGTSTVSMEYSRPWEGGEKREWTFTLTVVVK